jgi:pimeloyl-ACP methyl ester carboxylesterase
LLSLTSFFRLVKDCEAIRQLLLGHKSSPEDRKWTILGQSFGGFCAINYLSFHPEGIKEVFLTGGLPPLVDQPDPVYESLARKSLNRHHVAMFLTDCPRPGDQTQYYLLRKISPGCQTSI